MLAGVLIAEKGVGTGIDADVGNTGFGVALCTGAGVVAAVEAGDAAVVEAAVGIGSGGGVKMPMRCLASLSFSSLAALAAALSC